MREGARQEPPVLEPPSDHGLEGFARHQPATAAERGGSATPSAILSNVRFGRSSPSKCCPSRSVVKFQSVRPPSRTSITSVYRAVTLTGLTRSSTVSVWSLPSSYRVTIVYVAITAPLSRSSQCPIQSQSTRNLWSNDRLIQRNRHRPPASVIATIDSFRSLA